MRHGGDGRSTTHPCPSRGARAGAIKTPPCWTRCSARPRSASRSSTPTCGSAASTARWPGCANPRRGPPGRGHRRISPAPLRSQGETALRRVLDDDQPVLEADQPVIATDAAAAGPRRGAHGGPRAALGLLPGSPATTASERDRRGADRGRHHRPAASAEAVRRSEARYRSLVRAAQVVWVTTPAGEIAEDSPEWRWITGQPLEEYLGLTAGWMPFTPRTGSGWSTPGGSASAAGRVFDNRYRVRTKAGAYRHYDVRAVPMSAAGEAIVEWVGASTDVTAQREAAEMRGRLTEQLSAAALRTARLQQATSMLAEALTVEQVVEVITEVGRSAVQAPRRGPRWRCLTTMGCGCAPSTRRLAQRAPAGRAQRDQRGHHERRPVLVEDPDALRRQCDPTRTSTFSSGTATSRPGSGCRCSPRARRWARSGSRSRPRRSPKRNGCSSRPSQASARSRSSGPRCSSASTPAETLQRSLLQDRLPTVPGVILDARYLPVTRNMEIGGDWYDAFKLRTGGWPSRPATSWARA